jgi:hypothetical protein
MLIGELALTTAAAFTGAAVYVNAVEQPARLALDDKALLMQWQESYPRGFAMQASLALGSALFGLAACWLSGDWRWVVGALLIFANWPFTLLAILPVNKRLQAVSPDAADRATRRLIETWGLLHGGRSVLGLLATVAFIWSSH